MVLPRYGRVRLLARPSPFGSIQGVFRSGVHVLSVLLYSIHPSFLGSTVWSPVIRVMTHGFPCHRVFFAAYDVPVPSKPTFSHFCHDFRDSQHGQVVLVRHTIEAFAFPSRVGPAHALLSLDNTPIRRG